MRNSLRAAGALSAATALALGVAMPAQASFSGDSRCGDWVRVSGRFEMCIHESGNHAFWGDFRFWNETSEPIVVDGSLLLQRCGAGTVDCSTIETKPFNLAIDGNSWGGTVTSFRLGTFGSTFRTCSSGHSLPLDQAPWFMACTPTNSYTLT